MFEYFVVLFVLEYSFTLNTTVAGTAEMHIHTVPQSYSTPFLLLLGSTVYMLGRQQIVNITQISEFTHGFDFVCVC